MSDLPAPLTPPDCDLSGLEWMPLDVERLKDSLIADTEDAEAFRAAVLLWCAAWRQIPAGSVPSDDRELAKLAGLARQHQRWLDIREEALRGFVLCNDGRLYHHVVSRKALEAWVERLRFRKRSALANAARYGRGVPQDDFEAQLREAKRLLDALSAKDSSFKEPTSILKRSEVRQLERQLPTEPDVLVLPRASRSGLLQGAIKEGKAPKEKRKLDGTRLPIGWYADSENRAYAAMQGFTPEEIDEIEEDFRLWWPAQPGAKGRKTDWSLTWKTWVRSERKKRDERAKRSNAGGRGLHSADRLRAFHAGGLAAVDQGARKRD